jgi:hypothetical protein
MILIFRQPTEEESDDVVRRSEPGSDVYVMPGIVVNLPIEVKVISDEIVKEAVSRLIDEIKLLGDKVIDTSKQHADSISSKTVAEMLTFEKMSVWHYQRFRMFFLLRNEWIINHCIERLSETGETLTCYVPGSFNCHSRNDVANILLIRSSGESAGKISVRSNKGISLLHTYLSIVNYTIFFILRVIIGAFRNNHLQMKSFVVIDRSLRQQTRNINTLEKKWDNFNLSPLFDSNPDGLLIISDIETPKFKSGPRFSLHKYYFNGEGRRERTYYSEPIMLSGLLAGKVRKERKKWMWLLKEQVQHIGTSGLLSEQKRIFDVFVSLTRSTSFFIFKYLAFREFFGKHKFLAVAAIDENSPATKCILDAGKASSMKAIGIQHGNIGPSQPAYLYTAKDKEHAVMADMTITWGHYWSDFLVDYGNFPPEKVAIAGQMRSDLIPAMKAKAMQYKQELSGVSTSDYSPQSSKTFEDLSYLVTFASQPIPDINYRRQLAYDVFSCFKRYPEIKLILKLHPAEKHSAGWYKSIAKEAGYENPDIRYNLDLYELLAASDLVITGYSTVGSEAVYFGKPLIIYDPFKEDLLQYVKEKVAFQATGLLSLEQIVDSILNGSLFPDKERYEKFIEKYAHAIDAKATERTIDCLKKLTIR